MAGRGSLAGLMPYGNANQMVLELGTEVLTAVRTTPVLAGVCGTDPFLMRDRFLRELAGMGFAGIQNFPTVGLIDGGFRASLEETGMGFALEVDCIAAAARQGLFTSPYVFDADQAGAMAAAGADLVIAHLGLTTGGAIGARSGPSLQDCVAQVQAIADAAHAVRHEVLVLCHGGPLEQPADARHVLERTQGVVGFYGASALERDVPTERAILEQATAFLSIGIQQRAARA